MYFTSNWSADEYNSYVPRTGYWVKLDDMLDTLRSPSRRPPFSGHLGLRRDQRGYDGLGHLCRSGLKDTATQNCWDVNGTLLAELGYDVDAVCAATWTTTSRVRGNAAETKWI